MELRTSEYIYYILIMYFTQTINNRKINKILYCYDKFAQL